MSDDVTAVRNEETVQGSPRAKARLAQMCGVRPRTPLTLERIEATLQRALGRERLSPATLWSS